MSRPTYAEVREETLDALQRVADLVPEPKDIVSTAEFDPYSCSDELLGGSKPGSFFTGQWALFVGDYFDVPGFIAEVPGLLGDEWHVEELGVQVDFAEVYLVRDSPRTTMTIEESTIDGRKAVDLLATSRCGLLPEDDPEPVGPRGVRTE